MYLYSIVTIHVRGRDLKTAAALHGDLHLVDLAGSERVDRSEVTGDRLREAQHINRYLPLEMSFSLLLKRAVMFLTEIASLLKSYKAL